LAGEGSSLAWRRWTRRRDDPPGRGERAAGIVLREGATVSIVPSRRI
jgi:hypothetical protein